MPFGKRGYVVVSIIGSLEIVVGVVLIVRLVPALYHTALVCSAVIGR